MKQLITSLTLLFSLTMYAQNPWEKIAVNDHVNFSFPEKPKINKSDGQQTYILKLADSTANLIVAVTDLQALMGIDAPTLAAEMDKEESWEQAKNAFMNSLGTDATLIKEEMLNMRNTKSMRLIVNKKNDKGDTNVLTILIFAEGTNSYNVIFNSRGGKGNEKTKEQFFNTIEINK